MIAWCIEESERLAVDTAERRAKGKSEGSFHSTFAIAAFPSPTYEEFKKHQAKGKGKPKASQENRKTKRKAKPRGTRCKP